MRRWVPPTLLGLFLVLWAWAAVAPLDRFDWWLENLLVFLTVPAVVVSYRWFRFSDLSYAFLFVFVSLHVIGSHWSYARVPWPHWRTMGFDRNEYDRVVHFAYGLLLTYPAAEVFRRAGWGSGWRGGLLALQFILATAAIYEILEWATAMIVNPKLADAFLGQQGDSFDAVEDIALGGLGAVVLLAGWALVARNGAARRTSPKLAQ